MALLPFILCWDKRIALMIIQIFTEKKFSFNFWTAGPLNVVENNSIIAFQCEIIHPNRRRLILRQDLVHFNLKCFHGNKATPPPSFIVCWKNLGELFD